jgi:hypothetical protein
MFLEDGSLSATDCEFWRVVQSAQVAGQGDAGHGGWVRLLLLVITLLAGCTSAAVEQALQSRTLTVCNEDKTHDLCRSFTL